MTAPDTRLSLLLRVRDHSDRDAWDEFAQIYRPVICRVAVMKGLQPADAEDLAQQVLLSVAGAIDRWEPDADRARFRTWLRRVTDNAILNALTRGAPDKASGNDATHAFLHERPANCGVESDLLRTEYRREVFVRAAQQVQPEFSESTWLSFWLTAVEGMEIDVVAKELGRSRGSVYASRSRVMKRLKEKVTQFCQDDTVAPEN